MIIAVGAGLALLLIGGLAGVIIPHIAGNGSKGL